MRAFFVFSSNLLSLNRPNPIMKKKLSQFKDFLSELTSFAVVLLCLGITVQLLIGESLLGWDVVGNISKSIGKMGQSNFIGVAALLVLYSIFPRRKINVPLAS